MFLDKLFQTGAAFLGLLKVMNGNLCTARMHFA